MFGWLTLATSLTTVHGYRGGINAQDGGLVILGRNQGNIPWDYSSSPPIKGGHPLLIQQHTKEESKKQEQHSKA
jgi:hypothetical protein